MRELKQLEFLENYHTKIVEECIKNEKKTGYLQLYVDNSFNLIDNSLKFIEGDFSIEDFTYREPVKPIAPEKKKEAMFIYYSILWWDNKTKWDIKELILFSE